MPKNKGLTKKQFTIAALIILSVVFVSNASAEDFNDELLYEKMRNDESCSIYISQASPDIYKRWKNNNLSIATRVRIKLLQTLETITPSIVVIRNATVEKMEKHDPCGLEIAKDEAESSAPTNLNRHA